MDLELKLDRPDKRYQPGDVIRSTFHLRLAKELKTRFISMRIVGIGTTEFETYHITKKGCHKTIHVHNYGGYEEYFRHYKYFIGAKGALETTLPPGEYEFEEIYELPPRLPMTYEGDHGSIKYFVRVKIDNNWTSDKLIAETFTIEAAPCQPVDLEELKPIVQKNEVIFQSYLLKKKFKPLEITASVPKFTYEIGEVIKLYIQADNRSEVQIKYFLIKLEECVTFIGRKNEVTNSIDASGPGNNTSTSINVNDLNVTDLDADTGPEEATSSRVLGQRKFPLKVGKRSYEKFELDIPLKESFSFKDLSGSKLMRVEYFLRIVGVVNRFHLDPEIIVKIKVIPSSANIPKNVENGK